VHGDQSIDHLPFAFANKRHVNRSWSSYAPEFARVIDEMRNLGAPDFILAWQTISVRAGATDPASLDYCSRLSRLRQVPGKVLSTLTASNDYVLVGFHWQIVLLGVAAGFSLVLVSELQRAGVSACLP
jgi:hypothetical protein